MLFDKPVIFVPNYRDKFGLNSLICSMVAPTANLERGGA